MSEFESATVSREAQAEACKEEGNNFYRGKDYAGSIVAYSKAVALCPENPTYLMNRAAAYLMTLQFKECVADCDKAIELAPTNGKAYFRRASGLKGLGRLDEAIDALQAGLVHEPSSTTAAQDIKSFTALKTKLQHAKDLIHRKRFSEALRTVDELLASLGTTVKDLNMMKIECLLELQRIQEAYNLTNQLMRGVNHVDIELLRMRAKCLYEMGDIENAVKHLQQALRSDPDNTAVRTWYRKLKEVEEHKTHGNTAFKAGLYEEAIASWTQAIALDKFHNSINAKLYCNCANAYAKLRKHQEAVTECDKAIRCDPNFVKAYMRRAESNYAIGDERTLQKALEDYERVGEMQQQDEDENEDNKYDIRSKIKNTKAAIRMSKRKDLYKILGVARDADEKEINKAYRKAALLYHPDKQAGKSDEERAAAEAKFKAVGEAYEVLSDPEKKQRYDSGVDVEDLDNPHAGPGGHGGGGGFHGGGHGGIDPSVLFQMFMQQQGGGGGGGRGRGGHGGFHF